MIHECHFQHLAAPAVLGQISDRESTEFGDHVENCPSCAQRMSEMESADLQMFLLLAAQVKEAKVSSEMQQRFVLRATHAGVPFVARSLGILRSNFLSFAAVGVAVCLFAGLGWRQVTRQHLNGTNAMPLYSKGSDKPSIGGLEVQGVTTFVRPVVAERPIEKLQIPSHEVLRVRILGKPVNLGPTDAIISKPLFRLNPELVAGVPRVHRPGFELSEGHEMSFGYFKTDGEAAASASSLPELMSLSAADGPKQRVFHYSATLTALSLQNDRAIFTLKPRVREATFSGNSDLIRFR